MWHLIGVMLTHLTLTLFFLQGELVLRDLVVQRDLREPVVRLGTLDLLVLLDPL